MRVGLAVGLWIVAAVFGAINGYVRVMYLAPRVGEQPAHVSAVAAAVAVVLALSWVYARAARGPRWAAGAWGTGALWLTLSAAFEFLAGHYVFDISWSGLLADYRIWQGRLWPLVLLAQLVGPATMGWLLSRRAPQP